MVKVPELVLQQQRELVLEDVEVLDKANKDMVKELVLGQLLLEELEATIKVLREAPHSLALVLPVVSMFLQYIPLRHACRLLLRLREYLLLHQL